MHTSVICMKLAEWIILNRNASITGTQAKGISYLSRQKGPVICQSKREQLFFKAKGSVICQGKKDQSVVKQNGSLLCQGKRH